MSPTDRLLRIAATGIIWEIVSSFLFLWIFDYWKLYRWPDRTWMWARYLIEGHDNPIVLRWLIITALLPVGAVLLVGLAKRKVEERKVRERTNNELYGRQAFADREDMQAGGIEVSKKSVTRGAGNADAGLWHPAGKNGAGGGCQPARV